MNDINDYLQRKAASLGLERGAQLEAVQAHLDQQYAGHCRAVSLNEGILKITTPVASVASELRMGQVRLLRDLNYRTTDFNHAITRLIVTVAGG